MNIGVIGAGSCTREVSKIAEDVGARIAKMGAILICGGLGGVMEAAAKGAREAGGITVGILPGFHTEDANRYINIPIVTAMSHARNVIIVRSSDVLIAIEGGYGTLSEISIGLKIGKPVIGINTWKGVKEVLHVKDPDEAMKEVNKCLGII